MTDIGEDWSQGGKMYYMRLAAEKSKQHKDDMTRGRLNSFI